MNIDDYGSTTDVRAELIRAAAAARESAYAPYSQFKVGAAVLASSGRVYTGVNVENASYPCGICAERNAIAHAIAEGEREIAAVAIAGGAMPAGDEAGGGAGKPLADYCTPCGMCRQVMREFADPAELIVISARSDSDYREWTLKELLPESFGPAALG